MSGSYEVTSCNGTHLPRRVPSPSTTSLHSKGVTLLRANLQSMHRSRAATLQSVAAALRSALSDPEPDVRAAALFEALSKLKVISGEMTPILPEGLVRTTRGFQLQIVGLDPATGQLNTIFVGFGTKWPVPGFVDDKLS